MITKSRWSKVYESSEEELIELLAVKHIEAQRIHVEPSEVLQTSYSESGARMWCGEGSIKFTRDDRTVSVQTGDAIVIPANTPYSATAGIAGCVLYTADL